MRAAILGSTAILLISIWAEILERPAIDYASTISPILNRHCVPCHQPGEAAPFSLGDYANAKKWSPNILLAIQKKKMPPWKAEPGIRKYHDENVLSEEDVSRIRDWASLGHEKGDLNSVPSLPEKAGGWKLGEPDLVLSPSQEVRVSAEGADEFRNFVFKTDFKEDRYVSAFDLIPGNRAIVHHAIVFFDPKGESLSLDREDKDGQEGYLSSGSLLPGFMPQELPYIWVPGLQPRRLPEDIGFRLRPGSTIILQLHYYRTGKPETDQSKLGLWFTKEKPQRKADMKLLFDPFLKISAGKANAKWNMEWTADRDYHILRVMPHMHNLGKEMWADVRFPNGKTERIIHVKNWDIKWQLNYSLSEPLEIPAGSEIQMHAIYDNSAKNPANPFRPPKETYFGIETNDEMFAFLFTMVPAR